MKGALWQQLNLSVFCHVMLLLAEQMSPAELLGLKQQNPGMSTYSRRELSDGHKLL